MDKLKEFAQCVFREYNSEGSRTATNVELVAEDDKEVVYEYDYTSLNGVTRRMRKKFKYDKDGNIMHEGALPIEE